MVKIPDAGLYQNVRLWAGITSIGFNLALICCLAVSSAWWGSGIHSTGASVAVLGVLALAISLTNLPFDLLSGYAIEASFRNTKQPFTDWLLDWAIGRGLTSFALFCGFLLFWLNHDSGGAHFVFIISIAAVGIVAALFFNPTGFTAPEHSQEHRFEKALQSELGKLGQNIKHICWFDNGEVRFVNGYLSPSGVLCLSTTVARELTPREAALLAAREGWFRKSGASLSIAAVVFFWLFSGVLIALLIPFASALQAALGGSAVVTAWCFVALFVWPSLNRSMMTQADRFLLSLVPRDEISSLLKKVQTLNRTDTVLSKAKTLVFHPIPPLEDRIHTLS